MDKAEREMCWEDALPYFTSIVIHLTFQATNATNVINQTDNTPSHPGGAFAHAAPSAWNPLSFLLCGEHCASYVLVTAIYNSGPEQDLGLP